MSGIGRHRHSRNHARYLYKIQTEMTESDAIQTVVMQVAILATIAPVMVMNEADVGPTSSTNAVSSELL